MAATYQGRKIQRAENDLEAVVDPGRSLEPGR